MLVALHGESDGIAAFDPRLSTTYAPDMSPLRMGIELWLGEHEDGDLYPRRVAGERSGPGVTVRVTGCGSMRVRCAATAGATRAAACICSSRQRDPSRRQRFRRRLTSPLMNSFAAFQESSGIPLEALYGSMATIAQRAGANPLYELETGRMTESRFLAELGEQLTATLGRPVSLDGFGEAYFENLHPNAPMIELMETLRDEGYRMAICTNNVREWEPLWRAMVPSMRSSKSSSTRLTSASANPTPRSTRSRSSGSAAPPPKRCSSTTSMSTATPLVPRDADHPLSRQSAGDPGELRHRTGRGLTQRPGASYPLGRVKHSPRSGRYRSGAVY